MKSNGRGGRSKGRDWEEKKITKEEQIRKRTRF